jgi:teichuronic acid biosynthesis glycosyltransferase TuaC
MRRKPLVSLEYTDPQADVLVLTNGWPHEDNETYCVFIKRQVDSLVADGLRCDVLFIRGYRSAFAYPVAALRLLSWSIRRRKRYALVHAHSGEAALSAVFYRRAPLVVSYLGDDLLGRPRADGTVSLAWRVRRSVVRQLSRLAQQTITKSREMHEVLPADVRERNQILPNGVDMDIFRPIDRSAARQKLGWEPAARIAFFAADPDVVRKRYFLADAAVAIARQALPDIKLVAARGVSPDRIPLFMNAADCLLLTSSIEGSPNVVKEALMCNLPVVATSVGDVNELLEGVAPAYVCHADETMLAQALVECLRTPRRSNGRDASRRLDSRVVARSLIELYQAVAPDLQLGSNARVDLSTRETSVA